MLASLTRFQAFALLVAIAVLAALSLTIRPEESGAAITGDGTYSDVQLYKDIAGAVAGGEDYYHAATRLHRAHGFPTSPFVTVRLPTLAWIEAGLGWKATQLLLGALLAVTALAWFVMLRPLADAPERTGATLLVLVGGAMVGSADLVVTHELWAGVLVALATALLVRGWWGPALIVAAVALMIRELALPFVLIAGFWALRDGRRREALCWAGLLIAYAVVLYLHDEAVAPLSLPGDALSQGWGGMRGPAAPLRDIAEVTLINLIPPPLSYLVTLIALVGFFGAPAPLARIALPYLGGIAVLLAVFARPVNFYWAILAVPMVVAGLAFFPGVLRDLIRALRRPA
ncbi:hypothetical protein [Novosphingobium sp. AP12]|uniref:hypothetical protein n=1 Tax=Novosphingobium sp. AP12 TaxID=1144305 RepID=UPI000271E72A|nr:hypothetical protein [Novosphingobium sp. AP12]EJL33347.1 hypothetical protein PMI02_01192 [Novosphingobium sp. AP12]